MKHFILLFFFLFGYVYGVINLKYFATIGKKTCMKPLGCFEITSDFYDPLKRLINVLPQHRTLINTQFFLYTNSNPRHSYTLTTDNIKHLKSPLKVNSPTRFIVHGLLDNKLFARWQQHTIEEIEDSDEDLDKISNENGLSIDGVLVNFMSEIIFIIIYIYNFYFNIGSRRFIGCNHQRAVDFFHWSINNNHCRLVGYKCASWEQFLEGKCTDCAPDGSLCSTMGIRADERKTLNETNVKFYLKTSGDSPFCLQHYKIVFKLHKSKQATAVKGSVAIELHGDQENVLTKLTGGSRELHPGSTHFYLATTDKNLIKIKSVLFSWTDSSSLLNPINWIRTKKLYLEYIEVIPMNVVDKIEQRSLTTKLCPTDPFKPIYSKKPAVLLEVNCKN
ncbi:uncharacterized protein LOC111615830 [Centruroides sculpturatus]|uniref:uncharacterized protein LOC111615830 n=1 Tax=Centruroides sculpturatus TaxID=218467 RepID=UPI000C6D37DB|nr:uncharacterized protein LOC111615830 [Centruroides sculpturatus]